MRKTETQGGADNLTPTLITSPKEPNQSYIIEVRSSIKTSYTCLSS